MSLPSRRQLRSLSLLAGLLLVLATVGGCKTCQCNIRSPLDQLGGEWRIDVAETTSMWQAASSNGRTGMHADADAQKALLANLTEIAASTVIRIDPVAATITYDDGTGTPTPRPYKVLRLAENGVTIEFDSDPVDTVDITLRDGGSIYHQRTYQPDTLWVLVRAR